MSNRLARPVLGLTVVAVIVALAIQIPLTATDADGEFSTAPARVINLFFYFTIGSNILVAGVSARLLIGRAATNRFFPALRLAALVMMVITGIVYHVMLAAENETQGLGTVSDSLFHTMVPILAVAGWVLATPRDRIDTRVVLGSLAIPIVWAVVVLIRGAILDWYPYPFVDVLDLGYVGAIVNIVVVGLIMAAFAFGFVWIDRRLRRGDALR